MKIVVLDAKTLGEDISVEPLSEFGELTVYPSTRQSEVAARVADAECIVLNKQKINEESIGNAKNLRLVAVTATGYDNIDTAYCKSRGIAVCNVRGYSTDAVTEVTVAMALSLFTHLPEYNRFVKSGDYTASGIANRLVPVYREIAGKTWGIVGYGNIGRRVATVAKALGCRVVVTSRSPKEDVENLPLDELCRVSDVISIHTPLTEETRGMIGERQISLMKPSAILINVARGAVIDEKAAVHALLENRIGGLGVDVYSVEPFPTDSPYALLSDSDRACLTPHMAWGAYETRLRVVDEIKENIRAFLRGEKRNRVEG